MPTIQRYLDHPGFFVQDGDADLEPEDVPSTDWPEPPYVCRTERMIAVGTIADVDGEVRIRLDADSSIEGSLIFEGQIATPSGALSVTQSSGEEILRLENLEPQTLLAIGVDDIRHPRSVHLLVRKTR